MKVLYIGYYCEESDWGVLSRNNILALEGAGVDIACRPIKFSGKECPKELRHLQAKGIEDCDTVIQHVFPEHLVGSDKFKKNIAIFGNTVGSIYHSSWKEKLEVVDQVWVQSEKGLKINDGDPAFMIAIPHAIDTSIFNTKHPDLNIPTANGKCKFYTIGDTGNKGGLEQIIRSFHAEFDKTDDAVLMILMHDSGNNQQQLTQFVENMSTSIKKLLKLETGPELHTQDIVITAPVMAPQILSVHQYCDQYVSCNETLSMPIQELYAAGFGNDPIISEIGESANHDIGLMVKSVLKTQLQEPNGMFDDVYNGKSFITQKCDKGTRALMRHRYEVWKENPVQFNLKTAKMGLKWVQQFSFESVGNRMKEALNESL